MEISASPLLVESDSDASTHTRAQRRGKKGDKQPENYAKRTLRSAKKAVNDSKKGAKSHATAYPNSTNTEKAINTAQQVDGTETL